MLLRVQAHDAQAARTCAGRPRRSSSSWWTCPAPLGPSRPKDSPGGNAEGDAVDGGDVAVGLGEVLGGDHVPRRGGPWLVCGHRLLGRSFSGMEFGHPITLVRGVGKEIAKFQKTRNSNAGSDIAQFRGSSGRYLTPRCCSRYLRFPRESPRESPRRSPAAGGIRSHRFRRVRIARAGRFRPPPGGNASRELPRQVRRAKK